MQRHVAVQIMVRPGHHGRRHRLGEQGAAQQEEGAAPAVPAVASPALSPGGQQVGQGDQPDQSER